VIDTKQKTPEELFIEIRKAKKSEKKITENIRYVLMATLDVASLNN
jgi:hypothetical protein